RGFIYDGYKVKYLGKLNFFTGHDLQGIAIAVGLGLLLFFIFKRSGAFAYRPPGRLSVEGLLYRPAVRLFAAFFTGAGKLLEQGVEMIIVGWVNPLQQVSKRMSAWEENFDPFLLQPLLRLLRRFYTGTAGLLEQGVEMAIVGSVSPLGWVSNRISVWEENFDPFLLKPLLRLLGRIYSGAAGLLDRGAEGAFVRSLPALFQLSAAAGGMDADFIKKQGLGFIKLAVFMGEFVYHMWTYVANYIYYLLKVVYRRFFFLLIKVDYDHKGENIFHYVNILNFDFGFILLFVVFVTMLLVIFIAY
ncbi:MAG: hypothetical protein AB1796_14885, partial [Bacillota bacterium]